MESYDTVVKRRDLLVDYGPYGVPGLLLKVVPPYGIGLTNWVQAPSVLITTDVAHGAQTQIDFTSSTYTTLANWIENGAQENNAPPAEPAPKTYGCTQRIGSDPLFDGSADPPAADYATFRAGAGPVLVQNCAAGQLPRLDGEHAPPHVRQHATSSSAGTTSPRATTSPRTRARARSCGARCRARRAAPTTKAAPFFGRATTPAIEPSRRGSAEKRRPTNVPSDAGFPFFADRVQPMLVKRGCMMLGCHSGSMFHDFRLRGGSGGHFGLPVDAHELSPVARTARARIDERAREPARAQESRSPKPAASVTAVVLSSASGDRDDVVRHGGCRIRAPSTSSVRFA